MIIFDFSYKKDVGIGFYSMYFFFLQACIYCKKTQQKIYYDDTNWLFKSKLGLEDYFVIDKNKMEFYKIKHEDRNNPKITIFTHDHTKFGDINPLHYYRDIIKDIYKLKPEIIGKVNELKKIFPQKYNAIFTRLGDKKIENNMCGYEITPDIYVNSLIQKCKDNYNVFVHSDDHNFILNIIDYINNNTEATFDIYHISDDNDKDGAIITELHRCVFDNKTKKSVVQMSDLEKYEHTEKMLIAIEIMKNAENVILDYRSNVSRFIKLYFDNCIVHNVFNDEPDEKIWCIPPAFGFMINGFLNVPPEKNYHR